MLELNADWERLLSAERHLPLPVLGTVLVGGTAAAMDAGHRFSADGDHVLQDLRPHFEGILASLEAAAGWQTQRVVPPVLILGNLHGIPTGIRQLRRIAPLQTEKNTTMRNWRSVCCKLRHRCRSTRLGFGRPRSPDAVCRCRGKWPRRWSCSVGKRR